MRWLAGLGVVLAAIAGALYAVGYFLLPNTLEITRTVTIERPRATVFAQVNDLRIVKEWSPVYARDPAATYTFSADSAGEGQWMRWDGGERQIGDGELTIVRSRPSEGVYAVLRLGRRASFDSDVRLMTGQAPRGAVTNVAWRISAMCAPSAINIPCRYMNLVLQRQIERDLDAGLALLKERAERLPDVDFAGLTPEFLSLPPQPFLYIPVSVTPAQAGEYLGPAAAQATQAAAPAGEAAAQRRAAEETERRTAAAIEQARQRAETALTSNQLIRAGPLTRVTTQFNDERISFRIGYPYSGPAPLTLTGEEVGETPSGRVMRVLFEGERAELPALYARAYAYLEAHNVERRGDGLPWERVLSDPGETRVRIEIFYPIQ